MRLWPLPLLLLPLACATPTRIVATADDTVRTVDEVADDLASADVVALGELHGTPPVHEAHLALVAALHRRRGEIVIAMEMFERDVQTVLLQYLSGMVDEARFLAEARPWPDYERDYRPVVEYARANGLVVLAANAPRALATKVARQGLAAVAGERDVARETTAPEDDYWDAFVAEMKEHPGVTETMVRNFYAAQCLKDDTMAESITDHLAARRAAGARPLVVLICGKMHSDHGRGVVARVKTRMPDLTVRVVSAETVDDVAAGVYASPRAVADYVVVARKVERPQRARPAAPAGPAAKAPPPAAAAAAPTAPATEAPAGNPEGLRPALGLMPDYQHTAGDGVLVASVREGGAAEQAGIEPGDLIRAVAGVEVVDVEGYMEALDAQIIGRTITVRVRRESAEVDLQVKVASRPR